MNKRHSISTGKNILEKKVKAKAQKAAKCRNMIRLP